MNNKEQLLKDINEALPLAEKMQKLEYKITNLDLKRRDNRSGWVRTILALIFVGAVIDSCPKLSDVETGTSSHIQLIFLYIIAAVVLFVFFRKIIRIPVLKIKIAVCRKKLKACQKNPKLSWLPEEKRTAKYIFELSDFAKKNTRDPFKAILSESNNRKSKCKRNSNNVSSDNAVREQYIYQSEEQYDYDEIPPQSAHYKGTNQYDREAVYKEAAIRQLDYLFSKMDIPEITCVRSEVYKPDKSENTEIQLSPEMKISTLVDEINLRCSGNQALPQGSPAVTELITSVRRAYDFVRASTVIAKFEEDGKKCYGCRSLLDSVETYAMFMKCLTNNFDSRWLNKLMAVKTSYNAVPSFFDEEEYQSISQAPLNNKLVKDVLSHLPDEYTIGTLQSIIPATNAWIDKCEIDKKNIVHFTSDMVIKGNMNNSPYVYTFTKSNL